MNKILSCLLIITIATSCREKPKPVTAKPHHQADTPVTQPQTNIKPQPAPVKDTIPTYTRSVYQQYITPQVQTLLSNLLPDWQFPDPTAWEKYWFHQYKSDTSLVNFAQADFNGDQRPDYAFILQNTKGFAAWVLQSERDEYRPIKLTETFDGLPPFQMGLALTPSGKLDYILLDDDRDAGTVTLKFPGITTLWFESAAQTYYWENGKYKSVVTGD